MHRHNEKYGHGEILRTFCGVPTPAPILGEVQHSLFLSTHHFDSSLRIGPPRQTGREGIPFFSWQLLLPFPNQLPIGDPLLYTTLGHPKRENSENKVEPPEDSILVMPKMNEELAAQQRLNDYQALVAETRRQTGAERVTLLTHPRDRELVTKIGAQEVEVITNPLSQKAPLSARERTLQSLELLQSASLVVSDYFGAHVFRSSGLFGKPVLILGEYAMHRAIHPTLRPLLMAFREEAASSDTQRDLAQRVIGVPHRREPDELRHLLFERFRSPTVTRVWVAGYKTKRRIGVRFRQSPLWGKSVVMRAITNRFRRPIWEARFPAVT